MKFYVVLGVATALTVMCAAMATFVSLNLPGSFADEARAVASNATLMFAFGMGSIVGLLAGQKL